MIQSRLASIFLIIGICHIMAASDASAIPSDIRLLSSSVDGVEFIYTPEGDGPQTFVADGRQYTRFFWDRIDVEGEPGQPEIPVRHFYVAIPPGPSPRTSLVREISRTQPELRLPPVPNRIKGTGGIDSWQYVEDPEAYSRVAPTPEQLYSVSSPFIYRGYRVVKVSIYPVQFYAASRQARILNRIHLRMGFPGGQSPQRGGSPWIDPIIQNMVINPGQVGMCYQAVPSEISPPWPSGTMAKITIRQEGIYKITGRDLELIGVSLTGIEPQRLRLFNNGGRELPKSVGATRPDSLIENAIHVVDVNNDGIFDSDDYILFYGHGVTGWDKMEGFFQHYIHHYTEDNIYWLQVDPGAPLGKRMGSLGLTQSPSQNVTTTRTRFFREDEDLIYNNSSEPQSGTNWYMALYSTNQSRTYTFSLSDIDQVQPYRFRGRFKHVDGSHQLYVYLNGSEVYHTSGIGGVVDFTGNGSFLQNGSNSLQIRHQSNGTMYFDWFELEYSRNMVAVQNELLFESPQITGIVRYSLQGLTNARIFDISDPYDVTMAIGSELVDSCATQVWRHYLAVSDGHYRTPISMVVDHIGGDEYQDLRTDIFNGIDYIIIAADEFYPSLGEYEDHRETFGQGLNTVRIRVSDIFDQFGWGLRDPTAIRDFLRYVSVNWSPLPPYLLLVGDGDYDYKNRVSGPSGNWIPPFEDGSRCTDDWYVYFSDYPNPNPEMAVGRWTVTSAEETETVIQKIIQYEAEPLYGPWRHRITLVADDEYGDNGVYSGWETNHTVDTENIAEDILPRHFNLLKIYLIEYPVVWDAAALGRLKPQAKDDLLKSLNDGTLIVNYMGHGNPHVWSHEQVFVADRDLPFIDNGNHLPVFVAATCSWGLFDDPLEQSFPEQLLVAPNRGSIATIAASRFTGATSNEYLSRNFYTDLFEDPFSPKTLGTALLYAKVIGSIETEKYHVLGDPTLVVGAPRFQMRVTSTSTDTLQALSLFSLNGVVLDGSGSVWNNFNGIMTLTVYDNRDSTLYVFNDGNGSPFNYITLGSPIFRGPSSITNGHFGSRFVVPQDIAYGSQSGRFSFYYYGYAGAGFSDSTDGAGVRDSIHFAETAADVSDSIPPLIHLMLENEFFREGDAVSIYPQVVARISDSSGINLTGEIGHTLRLILDDNTSWDVTKYFEYDLNSYTEGEVRSTIGPINPGNHLLRMEAWDSFNNLAWTNAMFMVAEEGEEGFEISNMLPYPNPFDRRTNLTFFITRDASVTMKIYTVSGRLIYSQDGINAPYGYNWELTWDGRDAEGDKVANGLYLYKISATSTSGEHTSEIGRVVVMR